MSDYKGFRIWNKRFQAVDVTTSGVTVEYENDGVTPTGRMLSNGEFIGYYPNIQTIDGEELSLGVRASLEDTCHSLVDPNVNGVGWELDYDLYSRLNSLDGSDLAYTEFKRRNPLLYTKTTTTLPNGNAAPKSVRLYPSMYCYAMFFKHTSGYKLMVALSYTGMHCKYNDTSTIYNNQDVGWLWNHIHYSFRRNMSNYNDSENYSTVGGFMLSMIPPANEGGIQDDWHPEFSIRSENFYQPTSFPIVSMMDSYCSGSSNSNEYRYSCASWIRLGTSTAYNAGTNAGILVGTNMKTFILADTKGNIGLGFKYTASTNTLSLNPIIFIGPIYKKKLYDEDTLPQRFLGSWSYATLGSGDNYTSPNGSGRRCAWCSSNGSSYHTLGSEYTSSSWRYFNGVDRTNANSTWYQVYTAYPALPSTVYTNYRYSKAMYTTLGLIDEDVLRASSPNGLIPSQTFNDGQWCFMNSDYTFTIQDGTTESSLLSLSIRWDGQFNGTETFSL